MVILRRGLIAQRRRCVLFAQLLASVTLEMDA